jgi:hypothetical protein
MPTFRDWFEKPIEQIAERELIGIRPVGQEAVKLTARIYQVHSGKIMVRVINRGLEPWQLDFDRFTGLSTMGEYQIAYVGEVPESITHDHSMVVGYMNGRRRT